jgi:signal transduction histidine kinase
MKVSTTEMPIDALALDWIESESVKLIKESVMKTTFSSFVVTVVLLGLLYPHTKNDFFGVWATLHGFIFSLRFIFFFRENNNITLNKYYDIVVMSAGFIWGATVYLLFNDEKSTVEAIALCLIIIYGIASTINLLPHFCSVKAFLFGYGVGIFLSLSGNIIFHNHGIPTAVDAMSLMVAILFIIILYKFSKRLNASHDKTLELQYRNNLLIESLTAEKQTAIDAVEIKNRIMASATHDMRQPILALDLYTDLLIHEPETVSVLVPKIAEATKSVITMFDAMFDLARMSMNQLVPVKVHLNLQEMFIALERQYQPMAKSKGLDLRVRLQYANRELLDDPILLRRILSNLLSNAIKYTDKGGVLLLCRECAQHGFRAEVWDTGVGISPEMQEAVFSEFYKNPENTGTSDGFGLGLAIVAQLSVLLGHQLTMKSRRGRGTMMSVRLQNALV